MCRRCGSRDLCKRLAPLVDDRATVAVAIYLGPAGGRSRPCPLSCQARSPTTDHSRRPAPRRAAADGLQPRAAPLPVTRTGDRRHRPFRFFFSGHGPLMGPEPVQGGPVTLPDEDASIPEPEAEIPVIAKDRGRDNAMTASYTAGLPVGGVIARDTSCPPRGPKYPVSSLSRRRGLFAQSAARKARTRSTYGDLS